MSSVKIKQLKQALKDARSEFAAAGGRARAKAIGKKRISEIGKAGAMKRWYEYCGDCDGCGWYEGGKTIKTTCPACEGSGMVRRRT